jgi:hypothetical protein
MIMVWFKLVLSENNLMLWGLLGELILNDIAHIIELHSLCGVEGDGAYGHEGKETI